MLRLTPQHFPGPQPHQPDGLSKSWWLSVLRHVCLWPWASRCQISFPRETAQGHLMRTLGRGCPAVVQLSTLISSQPLSCALQLSRWHHPAAERGSPLWDSQIISQVHIFLLEAWPPRDDFLGRIWRFGSSVMIRYWHHYVDASEWKIFSVSEPE